MDIHETKRNLDNKISRGAFGGFLVAMSKGNRFVYVSLGFVAGLGLALLILVWTVPGFSYPPNGDVGQSGSSEPEQGNGDPVEPPSLWDIHTSPEDTYAQWVMALFAIAATGVSIWAIRLVRKTLVATQHGADAAWKAVTVTQDIGERQLRAYLVPERCTLKYEHDWPTAKCVFVNSGQTPADNIIVVAALVLSERQIGAFVIVENLDQLPKATLGANGKTTIPLALRNTASIERLSEGKERIVVGGTISYTDIFGDRWSRRFQFNALPDNRKRPKDGDMIPEVEYMPERLLQKRPSS